MATGDKIRFGEYLNNTSGENISNKIRSNSMDNPKEAVTKLLDNESSQITGPIFAVAPRNRTFQFELSSGASLTVEIDVTNDPNEGWVEGYYSMSSSGYQEMNFPWIYVRARITSYTSGSATVLMGV